MWSVMESLAEMVSVRPVMGVVESLAKMVSVRPVTGAMLDCAGTFAE
jgi:hypothetical protein